MTPTRSWLVAAACLAVLCAGVAGQSPSRVPTARLVPAPHFEFPGKVDSNTAVLWTLAEGVWEMSVVTSWGGIPELSVGPDLGRLSTAVPVHVNDHPGHGTWFESIVADDAGTWYGYYHRELPADACARPDMEIPSIGAVRSFDRGRTWDHLGLVLSAPASTLACASSNRFVVGGVGDVSAVLDHDQQYLYLFFTQYARDTASQGVAVARMPWADRDEPAGSLDVWNGGAWLPATPVTLDDGAPAWEYGVGTPLVPATRSWHDGGATADAFWGPSIHWNTYLERWVMLVNRTRNKRFDLDGHYVAFAPALADPGSWSRPVKLLNGGGWYSQVVGLEAADGTDKRAGRRARFFVTGRSDYYVEFNR
jgi:hypothetical protein